MANATRTFIDKHGGYAAVAKATKRSEGAVTVWAHRNRLPRTAWPEVLKGLPGVTLDVLLRIECESAKERDAEEAASPANDPTTTEAAA